MERAATTGTGAPARVRLSYLDVGKVLAILAVISIHTLGVPYRLHPVGSPSWWVASLGYPGMFWAVPLFVMASGALVIPRAMTQPPAEFLRARVGRLLIPLLFWTPIYTVLSMAAIGPSASLGDLLRLLASGRPYSHLYFLPLIIGLYLLTPLIARALKDASRTMVWAVALGALGLNGLESILGSLGVGGLRPDVLTWWVPFIGYFLVGYALSTSSLRVGRALSLALVVVSVAVQLVLAYLGATAGGSFDLYIDQNYSSISAIAMTLSVFLAVRAWVPRLSPTWERRWARLAALSFGVYLGHLLVEMAVLHFAHINGSVVLLSWLAVAITAVLSFIAAEIGARLPYARRLIGM